MTTNIQTFPGNVEVSSNLTVGTNALHVDTTEGNVGIGTVSPDYPLHVVGDVAISGGTSNYNNSFRGGYNNRMNINMNLDPDTPDCDRMTISLHDDECVRIRRNYNSGINSSIFFGNVGIGTVSPDAKLDVRGNQVIRYPTTDSRGYVELKFNNNRPNQGSGAGLVLASDEVSSFNPIAIIDTWTSGVSGNPPLVFKTRGTERMRLTDDGNVGIGTVSPSAKLDVYNSGTAANFSALVADFDGSWIRVGDTTARAFTGGTGLKFHDSGVAHFSIGQKDSVFRIGQTSSDGNILFPGQISDVEDALCITTNGNVGIGTASPIQTLHIYKDANEQTSGLMIEKENAGTGAAAMFFAVSSTLASEPASLAKCALLFERNNTKGRGDLKFCLDNVDDTNAVTSSDAKMVITAAGNVGIGTTDPTETLDVNGSVRQRGANTYLDWTPRRIIMNYDSTYRQGIQFITGTREMTLFSTTGDSGGSITFKTRAGSGSSDTDYGTERMRITGGGLVGIGVASPSYPLHVAGSAGNMPAMKYFNSGSTTLASGSNDSITIYAAGNIYASGLIAASDERIKKNIVDADDAECLETLRLLKPKKYQYKDEINRGQEPVWGFIAQEVRDTLQYATHLGTNALPNIYEVANVSQSNVITFTNFNTSNLEANAITIHVKTIHDKEERVTLAEVVDEHTIRVEEDLSLWTGSVDAEGNVITEITTTTLTPEEYEALEDKTGCVANISGYQNANVVISVEEYNGLEDTTGYEEVIENYTKTTTIYPGTQLFVYGQEVDDFIFVKKEAIWTVATAALQEVDRQLQAEKAKVATLETQLADLLARVQALETV